VETPHITSQEAFFSQIDPVVGWILICSMILWSQNTRPSSSQQLIWTGWVRPQLPADLGIPAEPDVRPCSHNFRFCHGFNTSLIPNPQGFPPFFHHFCHYWFHSVAFFPRCTLCSINSIITEGSKPATSPNNMYKGLIMVIVCHVFFHDITSLQKLQKDLNLPPPPTNTYKDLLMIMLYSILWKIKSGAKGPLSARKPRIRENLSKTRVVLPEKNRFRANVRICAYYFFPGFGVLNCGGSSNGTRTLYYVWFAFSLPTILFVLHWFTRTC